MKPLETPWPWPSTLQLTFKAWDFCQNKQRPKWPQETKTEKTLLTCFTLLWKRYNHFDSCLLQTKAKRQKGQMAKRQKGKKAKRQRGKEAKRQKGQKAKRPKGQTVKKVKKAKTSKGRKGSERQGKRKHCIPISSCFGKGKVINNAYLKLYGVPTSKIFTSKIHKY